MKINISSGQSFSASSPNTVAPGASVNFYTDSGTDTETVSFSTSPFTDGSTSFRVSGTTGVTKTAQSGAGNFPMGISGDREGELDISPSK